MKRVLLALFAVVVLTIAAAGCIRLAPVKAGLS